ncbi:ATP-binding protein [Devosia enhydra]|uniref:ATP-binding protein n=1 Tax=Devosia enhydra TaxID=665118 RepID=UPI00313E0A4B
MTDLDACAREPIHRPGAIQPHGALLVLDPASLKVIGASRTAMDWLGPMALDLRALPEAAPLVGVLGRWLAGDLPSSEWQGSLAGRVLQSVAHRSGDLLILEFEAAPAEGREPLELLFPRVRRFAEDLTGAPDIPALLAHTARFIRSLTGFDRALVYQFDADWNGLVEGEDGNGRLPSYLGLRFPASDIPAQARQLYALNRTRIIPNAGYAPVPIESLGPRVGPGLDLSHSVLRSVSPVHLEYMRNMGTLASMSVSIMVDGVLWGLVACHSAQPHLVSLQMRGLCDFSVQLVASEIAARLRGADAARRLALGQLHSHLLASMTSSGQWTRGLEAMPEALLELVDATGAAIIVDGEAPILIGATPEPDDVSWIVSQLATIADGLPWDTASLPLIWPEAERLADVASGVLAVPISDYHTSWLLWFRPEVTRTVRWAGEPHKVVTEHGRIHPRQSFASWQELVRFTARPWTDPERDAAANLRAAIVGIVLRRAEEVAELAEELQKSNKELEAFSYSVSHDLRAPFRHIVGYAELLRERETNLDGKSRHYLESIGEAARAAGQLVDDLLNFSHVGRVSILPRTIDTGKLVREVRHSLELKTAGREIDWQIGPLPNAWGDPTLIRQVWFNLVENAVKYTGPLDRAEISIRGEDRDGESVYHVKDNGVGFDMAYKDKLFGVFQRLQRAEDFEGTGIGLALARRIVERHGGRIWAEGEVGAGAHFHFSLPVPGEGESDV